MATIITKDKVIENQDLESLKEGVDFSVMDLKEDDPDYEMLKFYTNNLLIKLLTEDYKGVVVEYHDIKIDKAPEDKLPKLVFHFNLPLETFDTLDRFKEDSVFLEHLSLVLACAINNHITNAA